MFKKKGLMEIREVGKIGYADLCLGIVIGTAIGYCGVHAYEAYDDLVNPVAREIVCKKGIAYEAVDYGSTVFLKTKAECIETAFGEEMK